MTQLMTKLNSIQGDITKISSQVSDNNKETKDTKKMLTDFETELRTEFAKMEAEVSSGVNQ
jgi:predicted  nucleic acid-binding Zn-ribbon protein